VTPIEFRDKPDISRN